MNKSSLALLLFLLGACSYHKSLPPSDPLLPDAATAASPEAFLPQSLPTTKLPPPKLLCPNLDFHQWRTWQDAGQAMKKAPMCFMGQTWQPELSPALQACTVAVAHDQQYLIVYAEIHDVDIYNDIKKSGIPAFNSGDVFEIFLRPGSGAAYLEHHITPDNATFQLIWPSADVHKDGSHHPNWKTEFASHVGIISQVLIQPEKKMWRILALIPLDSLVSDFNPERDRAWRFSFSRYDYTHGEESPVYASTSPHDKLDFHQQAAWGRLDLLDKD